MHAPQHMYSLCQQHMHKPVQLKTYDGMTYHGILAGVDGEKVYLDVPEQMQQGHNVQSSGPTNRNEDRPYGYGYGYGYPGYGYPPYPPYGYYPGYGYRRIILPLAALVALSTIPFFW